MLKFLSDIFWGSRQSNDSITCDKSQIEEEGSTPISRGDTTPEPRLARQKRNVTDAPPRTNTGADGKEQDEF